MLYFKVLNVLFLFIKENCFVFYMNVGCFICVMFLMDKRKGKFCFFFKRFIFSCGFIEYKGFCYLCIFKLIDYM